MYLPLWSIDGKKDNKAIYKVSYLHICLPVWPALPTYMYLLEIRCAQYPTRTMRWYMKLL